MITLKDLSERQRLLIESMPPREPVLKSCRMPVVKAGLFLRARLWAIDIRHEHETCPACGCNQAFFVSLLARCAGCLIPIMPASAEKRKRSDGGLPAAMLEPRHDPWNDLSLDRPHRGHRRRRRLGS